MYTLIMSPLWFEVNKLVAKIGKSLDILIRRSPPIQFPFVKKT